MNLLGVAFANPAMWAGVFALSIPVAIHLLTRRTPVRLVFPTIRFLKSAKASQSRLYRVRHILLLLLRTAILALVLAAFLRPIYRAGALAGGSDKDARSATIIILDSSVSMGYTGAGVTPFSKAKVAAEKTIDNNHSLLRLRDQLREIACCHINVSAQRIQLTERYLQLS